MRSATKLDEQDEDDERNAASRGGKLNKAGLSEGASTNGLGGDYESSGATSMVDGSGGVVGGSGSGSSETKSKKINDLAARLKIDKAANKSFRYQKLCEKIGMDLTTRGRLTVNLKTCDRLPEALYSVNLQTTPALTQQQQQPSANSSSAAAQPTTSTNQPAAASTLQMINPSSSGLSAKDASTVSAVLPANNLPRHK